MDKTQINRCTDVVINIDTITFQSELGTIELNLDVIEKINKVLDYEERMRQFMIRIQQII